MSFMLCFSFNMFKYLECLCCFLLLHKGVYLQRVCLYDPIELNENNFIIATIIMLINANIVILSAISWREQINFQWDYDDIRFVLDQHAELDLYSASSLKQQSMGKHVAPLGHIILIRLQSQSMPHVEQLARNGSPLRSTCVKFRRPFH
jgi:hypothetical protein